MREEKAGTLVAFYKAAPAQTKEKIDSAIKKMRPHVEDEAERQRRYKGDPLKIEWHVRFKETRTKNYQINVYAKIVYSGPPAFIGL